MPKVLRILNRLNIGGPTFNAAYLTKYLAPEFETLLASGREEESEGSSSFITEKLGIEPHFVPHMGREVNLQNDLKAYRYLRKLIREFRPDVVHTHAAKAGTLGRLAAIHEGVPVVVHTFHGHVFHSYFSPLKTKIFLNVERYLGKRSSAIIAISELQRKELAEIYRVAPADRFHIVPLGFDLERFGQNKAEKRAQFRAQYGLQEDDIAIGLIGRIVSIKNHPLYLRAFNEAKQRTPQSVKAFVIGDGEDRASIEDLCESLNLSYATPERPNPGAEVIFTSWIQAVDVPMAGLDIIALTSRNEGTPVSLIEAQAAGKPIVATDVGGVRDTIQEGVTGFVSPSEAVELFAQNLLTLVEDPALRQRMGEAGPREGTRRFGYQRLVEDVRALYTKKLAEKGIG